MTIAYLTEPVPHAEAIRLISDKPTVTREVFDMLEPELRGRALTITGIEDFDVLQAVRDEIARLPAGADWKKVRKEIAGKISPWLGEEEAKRRADLLLNHHGTAAYAAANARVVHSQEDVFTHLMYVSSRTSKVPRESHAALDGLILPSNHPFWETHTPPWEFGCKCSPNPIPLTQEDVDEMSEEDSKRGEDFRQIADEAQLEALENGTLVRGGRYNVETQRQKSADGRTGYEFNWRDTTLPYEEIRQRWDEDVASAFETWAESIEMDGGTNLLDHLTGLTNGGAQLSLRTATIGAAIAKL